MLPNAGQRNIFYTALGIMFFGSCIRTFTAPKSAVSPDYLVVEGFINAGNDSSSFTLSRTAPLSNSTFIKYETGANVIIEGTDNSSYLLSEKSPGMYSCGPIFPNAGFLYRLHIVTSSGSEYLSDLVQPLFSPLIDSVTWANTPGGVTIYVNTHGNNNTSRFYHWTYNETFEFQSTYASLYYYDSVDQIPVIRAETDFALHYTCWNTVYPSNIVLGSTSGLSDNTIYQVPIYFLPDSSRKLKIEYSIMVQQQTIDSSTYAFFQLLHNGNDITGSIFDPQPTSITGNIHCVNNPSETVIGYVYATSTNEQRIFISHFQVTGWYPEPDSCEQFILDFPSDDALLQSGKIDITDHDTGKLKGFFWVPKPFVQTVL